MAKQLLEIEETAVTAVSTIADAKDDSRERPETFISSGFRPTLGAAEEGNHGVGQM